jgi:hypothetical protein
MSGRMRVVMVADFPVNSPFGFRPAPGARFRRAAILGHFICLQSRMRIRS